MDNHTLYNLSDSYDTIVITDSDGDQYSYEGNVDRYLWMYWSPFTFLVGVIGNIFIILVLASQFRQNSRSKSNRATTPIYLTVMAVADIGFLVFGIVPEWFEACEFTVFDEWHPIVCKLEKFMFYVTGDVAIWTITAFTFDRFVAVCFPFKKSAVCVPKYAKITSACIIVIAVLKSVHVAWTRGSVYTEYYNITTANSSISLVNNNDTVQKARNLTTNCGRPEPFDYFEYYIRPWIVFAVVNLVPFLVILLCNVFIIRSLVSMRRSMSSMGSVSGNSDKGFMQTIFMCMSVSFAFLLCVTPSMVMYIGRYSRVRS